METFYSFFDPIVQPLQWLLETIHNTTGLTWGWSIVVLTVIVRVAMIPLTVKQQQSFRALQALQPEIKKLQQKHKGDRQRLNEEMMAFYRENKVNPFGSCLPILVQLPIFFGLFLTLRDLSGEVIPGDDLSMFGGWIPNVTADLATLPATTLYPLMALYVVSQMGSTLLMPSSVDPKQKYIFLFLPIVFAYFIVNPPFGAAAFPVGLLVYWITTNLWTVGQSAVIRVWFPPPLPPSALARAGEDRGGVMQRLGLSRGKGAKPNAMPKGTPKRKRKEAERAAAAAVEASPEAAAEAPAANGAAAPAGPRKRKRKRPPRPPKGQAQGSG